MREILEEQILNETEKAYLTEVYNKINEIETREHRKVSFEEELKIRGAVTIDEFETMLKNKIIEKGNNSGIL